MLEKATAILTESLSVITDRRESYGPVETHFSEVAIGWGVIFKDGAVTPEKIPLAMVWYKLCRELAAHSDDNLTDMAAYASLGAEFHGFFADRLAETP